MSRMLLLWCAGQIGIPASGTKGLFIHGVVASFVYTANGDCDVLQGHRCVASISTFECDRLYRCATTHGCSREQLELPPETVCRRIERDCSHSMIVAVVSCYQTSTDRCTDLRACYGRAGCSAYSDWILGRYCPGNTAIYCSSDRAIRAGECVGRALIRDSECSTYDACLARESCEVIGVGLDPLLPEECQSDANIKPASIIAIGTALIMILIVGV